MRMTVLAAGMATMMVVAGFAGSDARPRRTRPDAHNRPSGGMVEKPYDGNVLRVMDAQGAVSHEKVADMVRRMRWATLLPFETVASGRINGGIKELSEAAKALAILNVAFLKEDHPDKNKLETRIEKMVWRALARSLQVGSVTHMPSVLQPFRTLSELDSNTIMRPSPEGFNAFIDNSKVYGITTITISSYRDACHKGWAPTPTNALQRAIWDQIQADKERGPTNPITIKPPKK